MNLERMNRRISKLKVLCTNEFYQSKIELIEMKEHLRLYMKQSMNGPYVNIGCDNADMSKEFLLMHLNNDSFIHSQLLVECIQNLRNDVRVLKENCESYKLEMIKMTENSLRFETKFGEMFELSISENRERMSQIMDQNREIIAQMVVQKQKIVWFILLRKEKSNVFMLYNKLFKVKLTFIVMEYDICTLDSQRDPGISLGRALYISKGKKSSCFTQGNQRVSLEREAPINQCKVEMERNKKQFIYKVYIRIFILDLPVIVILFKYENVKTECRVQFFEFRNINEFHQKPFILNSNVFKYGVYLATLSL